VFFSRQEVTRQGMVTIEPEHLLLGLLREPESLVHEVLSGAGLAHEALRNEIERTRPPSSPVSAPVEIPFSRAVKEALQFAAQEADGLGHADIGAEHLLLGLLREGHSGAASMVANQGLHLNAARAAVVRLRSAAMWSAPAARLDLEMLHAIRERLQAAENAYDAAPIVAAMADDMVLMVPNEAVQEGKTDCAAFVRRVLADQEAWFDRRMSYVSEEVSIRGDVGFDRGSFSFTVVVKHDGRQSGASGKYLWLYARTGAGRWKLARAILSLDDPPEDGDDGGSAPPVIEP